MTKIEHSNSTYAIVAGFIIDNGKYFIAKRASNKTFAPNKWEIPSGFVADHERAEDTIIREIEEEFGTRGIIEKALPSYEFFDEEARWVILPFVVNLESGKLEINPSDHSKYQWVNREKFLKINDLKLFERAINNI